jgi:hypothetical protein
VNRGFHSGQPMGIGNGHEMMVAIAGSTLTQEFTNKRVYICSITALAIMLAASPLGAAGNIAAPDPSSQKLGFADRGTGKPWLVGVVRETPPKNSRPLALPKWWRRPRTKQRGPIAGAFHHPGGE